MSSIVMCLNMAEERRRERGRSTAGDIKAVCESFGARGGGGTVSYCGCLLLASSFTNLGRPRRFDGRSRCHAGTTSRPLNGCFHKTTAFDTHSPATPFCAVLHYINYGACRSDLNSPHPPTNPSDAVRRRSSQVRPGSPRSKIGKAATIWPLQAL